MKNIDNVLQVDWFDTEYLNVKVKRVTDTAQLPTKAHQTDAGYDLYAHKKEKMRNGQLKYTTGLCFEIPDGYMGLLFPRSSLSNYNLALSNSVGIIDSGYRGEISFVFNYTEGQMFASTYNEGDRIGQLIIIPYPEVKFEEVKDLSESPRGAKGFGSSGV